MKYSIDLHIHSALSPCASNEMTPNNIVNMAYLNKLDIIAVTDHNSVENLPAVEACAQKHGILLVPGMELETSEEIHVLCYLPDLEKAFQLQKYVFETLPDVKNRVDIFGDQFVFDETDKITGSIERMLVTACRLPIQEVFTFVDKLGGVAVPAHINRRSYSILSNLGYIPEELGVTAVEFDKNTGGLIKEDSMDLHKFYKIHSSDSHSLESLSLLHDFSLELPEKDIISVINCLKCQRY